MVNMPLPQPPILRQNSRRAAEEIIATGNAQISNPTIDSLLFKKIFLPFQWMKLMVMMPLISLHKSLLLLSNHHPFTPYF